MTARVIHLADYRRAHAPVRVTVTGLVWWPVWPFWRLVTVVI
jgi:hypothetical protein